MSGTSHFQKKLGEEIVFGAGYSKDKFLEPTRWSQKQKNYKQMLISQTTNADWLQTNAGLTMLIDCK